MLICRKVRTGDFDLGGEDGPVWVKNRVRVIPFTPLLLMLSPQGVSGLSAIHLVFMPAIFNCFTPKSG